MLLEKKVYPAFLICCLLLFTAIANAAPVRAVWMYNFSILDNSSTINKLTSLGINRVYLGISAKKLLPQGKKASAEYTNKVREFVSLAAAKNIQIHAMTLMGNSFFLRKNHAKSVEMISWIIDYQNDVLPDEQFSGIHIDTEPHTLAEWKSAKKTGDWEAVENLMAQYVELLSKLDPIIHSNMSSMEFSAAIQWKYNEWAAQGLLPSGDAGVLSQYLDTLVPMVYGTSSIFKIQERSEDEFSKAQTVVGIDVKSFESYSDILYVQRTLDYHNRRNTNYLGTSVHYFSNFYKKFQD